MLPPPSNTNSPVSFLYVFPSFRSSALLRDVDSRLRSLLSRLLRHPPSLLRLVRILIAVAFEMASVALADVFDNSTLTASPLTMMMISAILADP